MGVRPYESDPQIAWFPGFHSVLFAETPVGGTTLDHPDDCVKGQPFCSF